MKLGADKLVQTNCQAILIVILSTVLECRRKYQGRTLEFPKFPDPCSWLDHSVLVSEVLWVSHPLVVLKFAIESRMTILFLPFKLTFPNFTRMNLAASVLFTRFKVQVNTPKMCGAHLGCV